MTQSNDTAVAASAAEDPFDYTDLWDASLAEPTRDNLHTLAIGACMAGLAMDMWCLSDTLDTPDDATQLQRIAVDLRDNIEYLEKRGHPCLTDEEIACGYQLEAMISDLLTSDDVYETPTTASYVAGIWG